MLSWESVLLYRVLKQQWFSRMFLLLHYAHLLLHSLQWFIKYLNHAKEFDLSATDKFVLQDTLKSYTPNLIINDLPWSDVVPLIGNLALSAIIWCILPSFAFAILASIVLNYEKCFIPRATLIKAVQGLIIVSAFVIYFFVYNQKHRKHCKLLILHISTGGKYCDFEELEAAKANWVADSADVTYCNCVILKSTKTRINKD